MRWQISDKPPRWQGWLVWPLIVLTGPVWLVLLALILSDRYGTAMKRWAIGPRLKVWSQWFAWHPVWIEEPLGERVWLEWVERMAISEDVVLYRYPALADPQSPTPKETEV